MNQHHYRYLLVMTIVSFASMYVLIGIVGFVLLILVLHLFGVRLHGH